MENNSFVSSSGITVDDAFWANVDGREPPPAQMEAILEYRSAADVSGLLSIYGSDGKGQAAEGWEERHGDKYGQEYN